MFQCDTDDGPVRQCGGDRSVSHGIPYAFFPDDPERDPSPITNERDNEIRFWIHIALVIIGFILAILTFFGQLCKPVKYGKHASGSGRCPVPSRIAFAISDGVPGIVIFTLTYFISGQNFGCHVNIVMYCLFIIHYIHRGIINPIVGRFSQKKVTLWIPVSAFIANVLYHYINADFIGSAFYCRGYYYDPRFIIGLILFITGFIINRAADTQLVCIYWRKKENKGDYVIPKGPLFYLISCPNYFGEGLQWFGWTIMTWSLAGLVWWLFTEATFIPRSRHNHKWYKDQFLDYPPRRKALIPFIY